MAVSTVGRGAQVGEFARGAVRLHILHHASEAEVHGAWMATELARHGYAISPGTLYPLLHRMQSEGLLTSRRDTVDGRARRLYAITTAGRAELSAEKSALAELAREVLADGRPPGVPVQRATYEARPIGRVQSSLTRIADAPNQGDQGAPDAWLVIDPELQEGIRDIAVGTDLLVLTWLHHSRRDELSTVPGDDPIGPPRGVFSTRSPARPNPIGLHRVIVSAVDVENARVRVRPLEVIDGTPVLDLKPVIRPCEC